MACESNVVRMLDKYLLSNKSPTFVEKKAGTYFMFKSPENKNYIITEDLFCKSFKGRGISKYFEPRDLIEDDIFTIENKDVSGIIQYKRKLSGDYYIMKTNGVDFAISGADIDSLPIEEKNNLMDELVRAVTK
jgi:hypothetical protein